MCHFYMKFSRYLKALGIHLLNINLNKDLDNVVLHIICMFHTYKVGHCNVILYLYLTLDYKHHRHNINVYMILCNDTDEPHTHCWNMHLIKRG